MTTLARLFFANAAASPAKTALWFEGATLSYDLWVVAILSFVWLVPPAWVGDPVAHGPNFIHWVLQHLHG